MVMVMVLMLMMKFRVMAVVSVEDHGHTGLVWSACVTCLSVSVGGGAREAGREASHAVRVAGHQNTHQSWLVVQALPATTTTTIYLLILLINITTSLATSLDLPAGPGLTEQDWLPPQLISCGKV